MTNFATRNTPKSVVETSSFGSASLLGSQKAEAMAGFAAPQATDDMTVAATMCAVSCDRACSLCPIHNLLCGGLGKDANDELRTVPVSSSLHTIPARRLILHPKEWSEYVPIICSGWAMSSIALPDG